MSTDAEFENYLKDNEKFIWLAIRRIGLQNEEDKEDLFVEGQRVIWSLYSQGNINTGLLRVILYRRLIDYMRTHMPLSRYQYRKVVKQECPTPVNLDLSFIDKVSSNDGGYEMVEKFHDLDQMIKKNKFRGKTKEVLVMVLMGMEDEEIAQELNSTLGLIRIYRSKIRQIYQAETERAAA